LSQPGSPPTRGLRERKKAKTRAAIQAHALRLFCEQGYDATTVEQICEAAEVSESTFYRYFPNKPDVVLWDEFDPLIVAAFHAQPPELTPLQALRAAFGTVFAQLTPEQRDEQRQRTTLAYSIPELRAVMLDGLADTMQLIAVTVAERTGRAADSLAVRTLAGAVIGASMAVMLALVDEPDADVAALFDQAISELEAGFTA
jgi:AcrR family transcriptional regulator